MVWHDIVLQNLDAGIMQWDFLDTAFNNHPRFRKDWAAIHKLFRFPKQFCFPGSADGNKIIAWTFIVITAKSIGLPFG